MELQKRFSLKDWSHETPAVVVLIATAFFLKIFYVFFATSYESSIHNDMAAYWIGAFRNNWGNFSSPDQFALFPPFFIYFLGLSLRVLFNTGLFPFALPLILIFHIAVYCFSSVFIFFIIKSETANKRAALLGQAFYLFSYTALNMNALILPDNLAMPLMIICLGLLFLGEFQASGSFVIGLLLGTAIAAKPLLILFGGVFVWRILKSVSSGQKRRAISFLLGFCLVPFLVTVKNFQLSSGSVLGLGVNGGVNFFQGWGQTGKITTQNDLGYYWAYSPGAQDEPSWKAYTTDVPFSNQGYYYRKGLEYIRAHPRVLLKKLVWFKKLFFGNLGPFLSSRPPGYAILMHGFNGFLYLMFLFVMSLSPYLLKEKPNDSVLFLLFLLTFFFLSIYLFGLPERRYLTYIEPIIIMLFFISIGKFRSLFGLYQENIRSTMLAVATFFICLPIALTILHRFIG